jgi:hypothetical protein
VETGVYLAGIYAGFGLAFCVGFVWGLFFVAWSVLVRIVSA